MTKVTSTNRMMIVFNWIPTFGKRKPAFSPWIKFVSPFSRQKNRLLRFIMVTRDVPATQLEEHGNERTVIYSLPIASTSRPTATTIRRFFSDEKEGRDGLRVSRPRGKERVRMYVRWNHESDSKNHLCPV